MKKSGILLFIFCSCILSCKTTDVENTNQSSDELYTANYEVISMKGRELDKKKPTIYINADENAVSGNATCNDYRFEFKMNDKQVQMNRGISTKMYCEDEMEIERSFMGLMGNVSFISQSDEFLYLKDADNKLLIKAKKYKRS